MVCPFGMWTRLSRLLNILFKDTAQQIYIDLTINMHLLHSNLWQQAFAVSACMAACQCICNGTVEHRSWFQNSRSRKTRTQDISLEKRPALATISLPLDSQLCNRPRAAHLALCLSSDPLGGVSCCVGIAILTFKVAWRTAVLVYTVHVGNGSLVPGTDQNTEGTICSCCCSCRSVCCEVCCVPNMLSLCHCLPPCNLVTTVNAKWCYPMLTLTRKSEDLGHTLAVRDT